MAVDVFDTFLKWETTIGNAFVTPEIRKTADFIRSNGPDWLLTARSMTKAYKQNRTPEKPGNLDTAIAHFARRSAKPVATWKPTAPPNHNPKERTPCNRSHSALIEAAIALIEKIPSAVAALKQSAELTPEQEALLDQRIAALKDQAHWK